LKDTWFSFKTFKLINENSAIKVNTDGVLLGAWADLSKTTKLLDVGTGGGVIAFIARHRNPRCIITGIDIDNTSIEEARENLTINSFDNINFLHTSIQDYCVESNIAKYDTIISNPPFFQEKLATVSDIAVRKQIAKHQILLSASDLINYSHRLLAENGQFYCIYPATLKKTILILLDANGLYIKRIVDIRGKTSGRLSRVMFHATNQYVEKIEESEMSIREVNSNEVSYTQEYINLTQDLYLNF